MIIISPFLDNTTLKSLRNNSKGKRYLFSRKEELDKLSASSLEGYEVYAFSQRIVDGEFEEDEGAEEETLPQNLHAKLYIFGVPEGHEWFLGSANCSQAAFKRNNEFLIQLDTSSRKTSIAAIKSILLNEGNNTEYFEQYQAGKDNSEEIENEIDFRIPIYQLLDAIENKGALTAKWNINTINNEKYDIHILIKALPLFQDTRYRVSLSLYGRADLQLIDTKTGNSFEGINLYNLNPFIQWRIEHIESKEYKEFILKMDINLPVGRRDAIFKSIIESKDKFFQFIHFLLGNDLGHIEFQSKKEKGNGSGKQKTQMWNENAPILEELLIATSRNPSLLVDIDRVIQRLESVDDGSIIPDDFKSLWSVFKPFADDK